MICIDAENLRDGLYNIKDGKIFKYKAKGGTVRTYELRNIVTCGECKYASDDGTYGCMCEHFNDTGDAYHRMWSNDFCSRGERNCSEKPNKSEIPTGSERSRE